MKTKFCLLLFFNFLLMGCNQQKEKSTLSNNTENVFEVPERKVLKSTIKYNHKISLWTLNDQPYSGFVVSYYNNNTLKEKFGILNGRKQNKFIQWFPDGHLKNVANYNKGKLHGEKKYGLQILHTFSLHILIIIQEKHMESKINGIQLVNFLKNLT